MTDIEAMTKTEREDGGFEEIIDHVVPATPVTDDMRTKINPDSDPERVGTIAAWQFRQLLAREKQCWDGWLDRATRNGPSDESAAEALLKSAARYTGLRNIYWGYFRYPDEISGQ